MSTGLLQLKGAIRLDQFWPTGGSDADTVNVDIAPSGAFQFRPHPTIPFATKDFFYTALVKGSHAPKPAVKNDRVTIRLQGIDAPELHYPMTLPQGKKNLTASQLSAWNQLDHAEWRQPSGESSTVALGKFLRKSALASLPCVVTSAVDTPNEVFDVFGRLIGDITVTIGGQQLNVNHWLVEQGWAYPTFYVSMSNAEIDTIVSLGKKARTRKAGIWKNYTRTIPSLKPKLSYRDYRKHPAIQADPGAVIFPKIFRRLVTYTFSRQIGLVNGSFTAFMKTRRPPDRCYITSEFLKFGLHSISLAQHTLDQFVPLGGKLTFEPDGLVFQEQDSTLVDKNGVKIVNF